MRGLVYTEVGKIKLKEVEKPILTNDTDVIVKITTTTICGSDVHLVYGHIPTTPGYVLGHEYVGVVEEVGTKVKNFKPGDRVIGPAAPYCGQCENCKKGNIAQCKNGGVHGSGLEMGGVLGTHADYTRVPFGDVNLLHVPDGLSDEQVLFVGDIFATGYHAVEKGRVKPGDTVAIFGAGPVGLCAVQSAKLFNASNIILVGRKNQLRLDIGQKLGATHIIRSNQCDPLEEIMKITNGKGVDVAIEAAGSEISTQQALQCVGVGGVVSMVGLYAKEVSLPLHQVLIKNIAIEMGLGYLGNMGRLLNLIESGSVDLTPIITQTMSLDDVGEAFRLFEGSPDKVVKIAIKTNN
ncbi:alcohol dehydrogenase catalytic domain-containing protein [Oscillospiraceae bacterium PP1C4]